jgi:hypothetical protein
MSYLNSCHEIRLIPERGGGGGGGAGHGPEPGGLGHGGIRRLTLRFLIVESPLVPGVY